MTFNDPFLLNDADALTETCTVAVPTATQHVEDAWGVGVTSTETTHTLACMEIPSKVYIDRQTGFQAIISLGLVVSDPEGLVKESARLTYNGKTYTVKELLTASMHSLKRVLLSKI